MLTNNIQIKLLSEGSLSSFKELIKLFQEVFEHEYYSTPRDSHLLGLLAKPDFVAYVIIADNQLIGGLTAYALKKYYSEESEFFIYDIAIKPEFQRNGLGKKLLTTLKEHSNALGINEIFVAAHEEDEQAVDFYRSSGGEAEKVVHFNYYAKR